MNQLDQATVAVMRAPLLRRSASISRKIDRRPHVRRNADRRERATAEKKP
jgi:hypothetical protein